MHSRFRLIAVAVAMLVAIPSAAFAAIDPFAADPLGLIAYRDQVRAYSSGVDTWEVWVCDTDNGTLTLDPAAIADQLNEAMDPYFMWLSASNYRPTFTPGGIVQGGATAWPDDPFKLPTGCVTATSGVASGTTQGAFIVVDVPYEGGFATAGVWCAVTSDCPDTYPQNSRYAVVGGSAVVGAPPALRTVAHEVGHAISLPHSYGGLVTFNGGAVYEYDNAMDVMSGGDGGALDIGTLAINRYAAGWLDPSRVAFHRTGTVEYDLAPIGSPTGSQILVLPTDGSPGVYDFLDVRVRDSYDSGLPFVGVEAYHVDQSTSVCSAGVEGACWGVDRRTAEIPAPTQPWTGGHVYGVGQQFQIRDVTIQVLSSDGSVFHVSVSGNAVAQRFVDDDGNPHEAAIEAIAQAGVTLGCTLTTDRYCPDESVTRAEMAVFIRRAIGDTTAPTTEGSFSDVPGGLWYSDAVERLAELGITTGYADGTFRPDATISRAEMAVFLTRAFDSLSDVEPTGAFADVPVDAYYAGAAEGILAGGVTKGCDVDPLRYCPTEPVRRDSMASFLARALGLTS